MITEDIFSFSSSLIDINTDTVVVLIGFSSLALKLS